MLEEVCEVIMVLPYIVKYALLHIVVPEHCTSRSAPGNILVRAKQSLD